jgi:hypothetical protein
MVCHPKFSTVLKADDLFLTRTNHSAGTLIYVNHRDIRGHITSFSSIPPRINARERVPSLGEDVDEFVDCFGFNNQYILDVYHARLQAITEDQFICILATNISIQEAKWLWRKVCIPRDRSTRVRNFAKA